jgi:hypothetical protein
MRGPVKSPCERCTLPDCDDSHRQCILRQWLADYAQAKRAGTISDEVRARNSHAYREIYGVSRTARLADRQGVAP